MRRRTLLIVSLIGFVALGLTLPIFQICRDWGFIDQNTGSRKGYREWLFGPRTGVWYQETALENFMRTRFPAELQQRWISYQGTGRNVFGGKLLAGQGRPGPIIQLKPEFINIFCMQVSESEKKGLYDALASGDAEKVRRAVDHVFDIAINANDQKTEQGDAAKGSQTSRSFTNSAPSAAGSNR